MTGLDKKKKLSHFDYAIAGGGAGVFTRMTCQPLDVLKIRFQLQVEPISENKISKYKSLKHATQLILREEGVKAFWKGHLSAQLLSVSFGFSQFWTYEVLVEHAARLNWPHSVSPVINFASGAVAGCCATTVSFPFDVVRTRLVAQSENRKIYSGNVNAFRNIVQKEGFLVLYRGLLPTFIQIAPNAGIQFMCYHLFSNCYKYATDSRETTIANSLASGGLAGLFAKTAVYPLDLAKKRMQIQGFEQGRVMFGKFFECRGLVDCLVRIYKFEGVLGLFKGLTPSVIKAGFTTASHFTFYEILCRLLAKD